MNIELNLFHKCISAAPSIFVSGLGRAHACRRALLASLAMPTLLTALIPSAVAKDVQSARKE